MAKEKVQKTNAMRLLDAAGIDYSMAGYDYDESDLSGVHAAHELGVSEDVVFKTLVTRGDGNAIKTAERLRAQLPENQMRLRSEDATLLASKAENGCIDAAIFSKEFADELKLKADAHENVVCIKIRVGEQ